MAIAMEIKSRDKDDYKSDRDKVINNEGNNGC